MAFPTEITSPFILTHRGLLPSERDYQWGESTEEAFHDQLKRGFGIEFDIQPCRTGELIVSHALTASLVTEGRDPRRFSELTPGEIASLPSPRGRVAALGAVLRLISRYSPRYSALHLKGHFQNEAVLASLCAALHEFPELHSTLLVFDCLPETAKVLRRSCPNLLLAPSAADRFDIARYGAAAAGTLITIEEAVEHRHIFDWVWLDEWDTTGQDSASKHLYTATTFASLHKAGFRIAVVSPELHATSPGLLGGEAHPDGGSIAAVKRRWCEILALSPDAVCTDYPEELRHHSSGANRYLRSDMS